MTVNNQLRKMKVRQLFTARLDAACSEHNLPNHKILTEALAQTNVALNRQTLQSLAIYEPRTFEVSLFCS